MRFAVPLALVAGCGFTDKAREQPPDLGPPPDAGPDVGPDLGSDLELDLGRDLGPDVGPDAGVPPEWICGDSYYGDGFDCDCGCGAADPDCGALGCADATCCDGTSCLPTGCEYCGPSGVEECDGLDSGDGCVLGECQGVSCVGVPEPMGTFCDNQLFCDGFLDECDASGNCIGTGSLPCSGHNAPTSCDDSCDETVDDCVAADSSGTSCNENADGTFGMCSGTLTEPNCVGD